MKTRQIALLVAMVSASFIGCSGTAARSAGCKGSAISVVTTFVAAVEAGDSAVYRRCELASAPLPADLMATLAAGGWLLDQAAATDQVDPPPAKNEIVIRIPAPDKPREGSPPAESGVLVTATPAGPGGYYVTKVGFYASS